MAYVRAHETTLKRNDKALMRYEVVWREPVRDDFGLLTGHTRARYETFPTREAAEARRDELNAARYTTGTSALAEQCKAGELRAGCGLDPRWFRDHPPAAAGARRGTGSVRAAGQPRRTRPESWADRG
jgi:hypothetical protein